MLKVWFLVLLLVCSSSQAIVHAQTHGQLTVSALDQKVHLTFTLDGESRRELERSLAECTSLEVRYIAELRKERMLWPDLSFARTMIRNRVVCDEASQSRTLQRMVDGSVVASSIAVDHAAVLAFMSETGDVLVFQGVTFPSYSYSVRLKSVLATAPDQERETGVLARTRFEIR